MSRRKRLKRIFRPASLTLFTVLIGFVLITYSGLAVAADFPLGKKVIKLGWASALKVDYIKPQLWGAQMAVEEINAAGGVLGSKLELATGDTDMSATGAISAIEKLVHHDKVDAIIGGFSSEESTALQEQAAKLKIVTLSAGSTMKTNERYLKAPHKYKYCFIVEPDETDQVLAAMSGYRIYIKQIKAISGEKGKIRVALVTDKALWTEAMDPFLKDMIAKDPDSELVYFGKIGREATNFMAELTQIRRKKAHFLFVVSGFGASIPFVKQWSQLKVPALVWGIIIVAMSGTDWVGALGADAAAYTGTGSFGTQAIDAQTGIMIEKYKKKFGRDPIHASSAGWLMVKAYAEALKIAKTLDADAVVKALEGLVIPPEKSWGGTLDFDKDHRIKMGQEGLYFAWYQYTPDGTTVIIAPPVIANSKVLVPPFMEKAWKSWK